MKNKYVFFGTPEFSAIILERLILAENPPKVLICNPDRLKGRKKVLAPPPSKVVALKYGIRVWQPEKLSKEEFEKEVGEVEFGLVAAYSKIIKKEILDILSDKIVGVHPSLLPKYRGASPIQYALMNAEKETGVSLYIMDEKVDHGPVISMEKLDIIEDDNYSSLIVKLAELSAKLILKTLPEWLSGNLSPTSQIEEEATFTKKLVREDAFVSPESIRSAINGENPEAAHEIFYKIKALNPEPGTWTWAEAIGGKPGKTVKLLEAQKEKNFLKLKKVLFEGGKIQNLN